MNLTQRLLNTQEVSYSSTLNTGELNQRLDDLFAQKTLSLAGRHTSDREFAAHDKLLVISLHVPYLSKRSAYLRGTISQGENGSLITLNVRPNPSLPVIAVAATLLGIFTTLTASSGTADGNFYFNLGLVFMALGSVYYPLSTLLRNRLRNKVVKYLGLSKV